MERFPFDPTKETRSTSSGRKDLNLPFITADQMREVDRSMVEDYGILLIQMMENAGRNLAHLARRRFLDGDPQGRRVLARIHRRRASG